MGYLMKHSWPVWLAIGLLVGLAIGGGMWPDTPMHAVATDRVDSFAIATGPVDDETEAVYGLDFLTGTLKAAVVSNTTRVKYQAVYQANIHADLAGVIELMNQTIRTENQGRGRGAQPRPEVQIPQNPRYMMVTGVADIRRGAVARMRPARSLVYIAEANTGIVMAYVLPWDQAAHAANQPTAGGLTLWAADQFTTAVLRQP